MSPIIATAKTVRTAKYSFTDDYSEGCHPLVLSALASENTHQHTSYGTDTTTQHATTLLKTHLGNDNLSIHFVPSGTSANAITISAMLRPHEAIIAATSAHIVVREAGAIEAKGHKIIAVDPEPGTGKLTREIITRAVEANWHFPHVAKPRLVYISQATELGTVYSRGELRVLREVCDGFGLKLFVDGARLPAALASRKCDFSLRDVLDLTDAFWIGGTKNGALLGEAVVIKDEVLAEEFAFHVKQAGCLLAKSWVVACQFAVLFEGDLFLELAAHANRMAAKLAEGIVRAGGQVITEVQTNQVFAILREDLAEELSVSWAFLVWQKLGKQWPQEEQKVVVRLVTSWATEEKQVERFLAYLETCSAKVVGTHSVSI